MLNKSLLPSAMYIGPDRGFQENSKILGVIEKQIESQFNVVPTIAAPYYVSEKDEGHPIDKVRLGVLIGKQYIGIATSSNPLALVSNIQFIAIDEEYNETGLNMIELISKITPHFSFGFVTYLGDGVILTKWHHSFSVTKRSNA